MALFEKNLDALRKCDPEMADLLADLAVSPRIRRAGDRDGRISLSVIGSEGRGSLNLSDPEEPALDSSADELSAALMVVLLGFGSGSMLSEVVNRTTDQTFVLLIEPDMDLFAAALREVDLSKILGLERVSLSIGEKPHIATLVRAEKEFTVFTMRNFTVVENPWSASLYPSYFSEVKDKLEQLKTIGSQNILTLSLFGKQWKDNIFENLPAILNSPPVSSLFGKYSGFPAVIVAAGPSLSKNKNRLIAVKGSCLVIAVDTAVRPLINSGVIPDIVVSIDSQLENYFHLEGIEMPDTLFVLNPVVHPRIVAEHRGPIVFMSYPEPLFEWIEDIIGERGTIRAGGSVATSAFDLAIKLGCSPLIFVGQDMAFTDGKTHAAGTNQDNYSLSLLSDLGIEGKPGDGSEDFFERENLFGASTLTALKMDAWRRWFELIIAHESVLAINATEGGIPIAGVENMSLDDAIARHVDLSRLAPPVNSGAALEEPADFHTLDEALVKVRDEARRVKSICAKAMRSVKAALSGGASSGLNDSSVITEIGALNSLSREILESKLFTRVNRWNVEQALDKVEETLLKGESSREKDKTVVTLDAYRVMFSEIYEIASHFEKGAGKAVRSIEKMITA